MTPEHEPSPQCLDAETMAAWVDRALPAAEAAAAEAHVADCARCQQMLAALVTSMPAVAEPSPWWRRPWVIGLVPLAAGSLALAFWLVVPGQSPQTAPTATTANATTSRAPTAAAPATPATSPAPPPSVQTLAERVETPSAASPAQAESKRDVESSTSANEARRKDAPAAAPAAPAPPTAADALRPAAEAASRAAMRAAAAPTLDKVATTVDVISPDPSVRWRIGASGSVQRSTDGGATWIAQASGVAQNLTAGASPQRDVCWVVGRAGTVLLFTDGTLWRRLEFPETVDLTRVDARDAAAATVTAADGRRFQTADGGRTWGRLQDF
ncbi:MAG: zf-HC2 domain-containing protein [Acidobacteriia bacterium]|nr:zf-HC2 domain-containing protein [Terriglobia bacterium]